MSRPALLLPLILRGRQYNTLWSRTQRRVGLAHFNPSLIAECCSRERLSEFLGEYNLAKCLENCLQNLDIPVFEVQVLGASDNPKWNPLAVCEDSFVGFKSLRFTRAQAESFIDGVTHKLKAYQLP